jgi:hypothetical protein
VSKIKRSRDARSIYTCSQALRHDMALALVYLRGIHGLCLRIFSHTSLRLNRVLGEEKAAHMRLVVGILVWNSVDVGGRRKEKKRCGGGMYIGCKSDESMGLCVCIFGRGHGVAGLKVL